MSMRQFNLGGFMEPLDQMPVPITSPLLASEVGSAQVSAIEAHTEGSALVPVWLDQLETAQAYRDEANHLSDFRAEIAPTVGAVVLSCEENFKTRAAAAAFLAYVWHTDRRDGVRGRASFNIAEQIIEEHPEAAKDQRVNYLLSDEVRADGAQRDEKADKVLSDAITEALEARARASGDLGAVAVLSLTDKTTVEMRNPLMDRIRRRGRREDVDVKARSFGKAKTAMLALGQGMMVLGKTKGWLNRSGLSLISASNAPSWGAVWQMDRHVRRQIKQKYDKPKALPNEFDDQVDLLARLDAEGEPLPTSIAA